MFIQTAKRQRVELVPLDAEITAEAGMFAIRAKGIDDPVGRLTRAASAFFGLRAAGKVVSPEQAQKEPAPGVFKEKHSGLLRIVHKEAVIRFRPGVTDKQRRQILAKHSLEIRSKNRFVDNQFVIIDKKGARTGVELVDIANDCANMDEVVFATPNFVSEFRRAQIPVAQWHLENTAAVAGQKEGEDVNALTAWQATQGKRTIVIAILDDGVDVDHPNLRSNIKKRPDNKEPRDRLGRDFFIPDDDSPEHFDPRPKVFQFPSALTHVLGAPWKTDG
jgi:subtilisin family serine protease